jgi:glycosyltransferase involved in cell wall biosynthesis
MQIAVDATCWHNRRGYGRHARSLLRALVDIDTRNHYTLFLDSQEPADPPPAGCNVRLLHPASPTVVAASAKGRRSLADMWRMSRALSTSEFDLLLFPTIYSYVPTFGRALKLVMVHDVIAETYPRLTLPRPAARLFWNAKVALGRRQADALVTVSEFSRAGILRHFGVEPGRVFVVGEAADPVFRKLDRPVLGPALQRAGIEPGRRLAVYVGGFSPHKNLETLVDAFARVAAREEFSDVRLAMVGDISHDSFHTCFAAIQARVEARGLGNRVIFTGYLPDPDLAVLLNLASVLVLPSLMEGFGLPAVEAAACGCPVIATDASPLSTLLGGAGIYIDPSESAIAAALETVLASPELRCAMGALGLEAAARLTWEAAARQMLEVIDKVSLQ